MESQLEAGWTMTIEVDSFYLPDTAGSAYRRQHVKSTIAIEALDRSEERLRHFHNAGFRSMIIAEYSVCVPVFQTTFCRPKLSSSASMPRLG